MEGVNSTIIYHKNFSKCHNLPAPNNNNKENSKKNMGDMISDIRQKQWGKHCGLNYMWNIKD
jgi:hypothetical protein